MVRRQTLEYCTPKPCTLRSASIDSFQESGAAQLLLHMASAAILRSVARWLRIRQPLEQRCLMERRFLSSSVPTERYPSSRTHSREAIEQKSRISGKEYVYKRLLMKIDKVSEGLDEHHRLLKQLEIQMKENQ